MVYLLGLLPGFASKETEDKNWHDARGVTHYRKDGRGGTDLDSYQHDGRNNQHGVKE